MISRSWDLGKEGREAGFWEHLRGGTARARPCHRDENGQSSNSQNVATKLCCLYLIRHRMQWLRCMRHVVFIFDLY
jgi:hypothetical protein